MQKNIIVLGASNKPERYSYKALKMLQAKEYKPLAVHPKLTEIEDLKVYASLAEIQNQEIDTITVYVNPSISSSLENEILRLKPKRVIFNPGSENPELSLKLQDADIETLEACTLVMLSTGQF